MASQELTMRLDDAHERIKEFINKPFKELFDYQTPLSRNKGLVGQLLEFKIGLGLSNRHNDFEDGELKTFKAKGPVTPCETVAVTMLPYLLPTMFDVNTEFTDSPLYTKIKRTLYVPVVKVGEFNTWYFSDATLVDLTKSSELLELLTQDYNYIRSNLALQGKVSSFTAPNKYFQVRTKDGKDRKGNYHPIVYEGEVLADKNHAVYLTKKFLKDIQRSAV